MPTYNVFIYTYIEIRICDVHGPSKDGTKQHVDLHMMCWQEIVRLEIFLEIKVNRSIFNRLDFVLTFN